MQWISFGHVDSKGRSHSKKNSEISHFWFGPPILGKNFEEVLKF